MISNQNSAETSRSALKKEKTLNSRVHVGHCKLTASLFSTVSSFVCARLNPGAVERKWIVLASLSECGRNTGNPATSD